MIFRSRKPIGKLTRSTSRSHGARYQDRRNHQRAILRFLKLFLKILLIGGAIGAIVLGILVYFVSKDLPNVESISTYIPNETTKIYSQDNVILANLHEEENRVLIPIDQISPNLKKTVVAIEDISFYKHHGLDFISIGRALFRDILAGGFVEGGSTLTQQLARNVFLYQKKTLSRKLAEAILAVQMERKYTKTEILEMYLNQVYWGHNAYGIESASQLYFDVSAQDLTVAQSAMLVGILRGPELYSPRKNFARAKERQKIVLDRMEQLDLITHAQAMAAYEEPLVLAERRLHRYKAPYFTAYIVDRLVQMYGEKTAYTGGMKVYTTLNYRMQKEAERSVKLGVLAAKAAHLNVNQGALVALNPQNGYILSMTGGVDFSKSQYNRAMQAMRQPGSAFKPFVYLAALEKGFSPGTVVDDSPISFNTSEGPYSPKNYTGEFLGPIPLRKALEQSINVVAIKLNNMVGPANVVRVAHQLGIQSPMLPVLSLPLGANEVTLLELTSAYGVLANGGIRVEPVAIIRIEDRNGVPLYQNQVIENEVFDTNLINVLVDMMKGVVEYGTGRAAKLPRPMAGKTGTTSDYRDAWFIGFVPQMVCGTWVGNDDNSSMVEVTGGSVPAVIWRDFMSAALSDVAVVDFGRAHGLVTTRVNMRSERLASDATPSDDVSVEKYWSGSQPSQEDTSESARAARRTVPPSQNQEQKIKEFFNL
ncbi:MAG: penicillin-binding protein 1A [Candidatus Margulisiibacteriota bacterium]